MPNWCRLPPRTDASACTFGALNPNFGYPVTSVLGGNAPRFQTPRQIRIGARFEF